MFTKADRLEEEDEDWEDIMEEMEDFWMRDPKVSFQWTLPTKCQKLHLQSKVTLSFSSEL